MLDRHLLLVVIAVLGLASQAAAHPGHGLGGGSTSALHYLSEPQHVAPWALAAVAAVLLARRSVRQRR